MERVADRQEGNATLFSELATHFVFVQLAEEKILSTRPSVGAAISTVHEHVPCIVVMVLCSIATHVVYCMVVCGWGGDLQWLVLKNSWQR